MATSIAVTARNDQLLVDENEQLRTALEAALEDNARLAEDRDRLRGRVTQLARDLQATHVAIPVGPDPLAAGSDDPSDEELQRREAEETLRVAFEELQVLTEELEVANSSLQLANQELDHRVEERTRQLREANATLRAAETSFRAVADLVPDLLWRTDHKGEVVWCNQRWFALTGQVEEEAMGAGWLDAVHPVDQTRSRDLWAECVRTGALFEHEHRFRDRNGRHHWFLVRAEPQRDEGGQVIGWFAAGTDVDDQRLATDAMRQSEVRFRTLVEGMPQLVWRAVDGGKWTWSSPQWSEYTGLTEEESRASGWLRAFHPDDRAAVEEAWKRAAGQGWFEAEGRILHASENSHRHFHTRALPVRASDGHIVEWLGTSTDVNDILELQGRQGVLVAELQHRTRNLLAVVRSMSDKTIKVSANLPDFQERFRDRLEALSRVQGLLSRLSEGERVTFDQLIRAELAALDGDAGNVRLDGPDGVRLRSSTVQTLAMAMHELATNAVKYGALGQPGARLEVTWRSEAKAADRAPWLHIDWRETGVAMKTAPDRPTGSGQGRELIERALPYQLRARTSFVLGEDGVHCTIAMPVSAINAPAHEEVG